MTIGIYNILTTLWFILMLGSGSILTYMTWDKIVSSDIIFIAKFLVVLVYILTLGTIIFLLIKLRLLFVTKDKLTSLYLFRLKKTTIFKDEITTSKWATWEIKAHKFVSLTITDKSKNQVSLSDFEFENFDSIAFFHSWRQLFRQIHNPLQRTIKAEHFCNQFYCNIDRNIFNLHYCKISY